MTQLSLTGVGAGPGGVTPVHELIDDFTTRIGPLEDRPLQSGQSWEVVSGQINDENSFADCQFAQPPNSVYCADLGTVLGDGTVTLKYPVTGGAFTGLMCRSNGSTDFILAGLYQADAKLYLYESVGGVLTQLDSAAAGVTQDTYYDMVINNGAGGVTATCNGVSVMSNDAFGILNTRWGLWGNELGCAWQSFHVKR